MYLEQRFLPNGQFYARAALARLLVPYKPASSACAAREPCDAKEDKIALLCIAYSPREASRLSAEVKTHHCESCD